MWGNRWIHLCPFMSPISINRIYLTGKARRISRDKHAQLSRWQQAWKWRQALGLSAMHRQAQQPNASASAPALRPALRLARSEGWVGAMFSMAWEVHGQHGLRGRQQPGLPACMWAVHVATASASESLTVPDVVFASKLGTYGPGCHARAGLLLDMGFLANLS